MSPRLAPCLLPLLWLAACDPAPEPAAPEVPASPEVATPAPQPQPQPEPEQPPEPKLRSESPGTSSPPVTVTRKPAPALSRTPLEEQQVTTRQPPFEFDLRLPRELLEAVEPYGPLELEPLLPAFFGRETESSIRLNGRLIESPTEERLFDGAEIRIEIQR